jgi:outer membrane protein
MKQLIIVLFAFVCFLGIEESMAQKFGHLNFSELYKQVPGHDSAQTVYEKYVMDIKQQMDAMESELQQKQMEYTNNSTSMTPLIKAAKERELQDLYARYEDFRNGIQSDLSAKDAELSEPLIAKARKAVQDIAVEHGYTYIFNSAEGLVLYATPSDDITELVKKKLGIK